MRVVPLAYGSHFRVLEETGAGDSRPFLLFVGSRSHYKNFEGLLETNGVWARRQKVSPLAVGKPWRTAERRTLRRLGIA